MIAACACASAPATNWAGLAAAAAPSGRQVPASLAQTEASAAEAIVASACCRATAFSMASAMLSAPIAPSIAADVEGPTPSVSVLIAAIASITWLLTVLPPPAASGFPIPRPARRPWSHPP